MLATAPFFDAHLGKELAKSKRYGRRLAVLVASVNGEPGQEGGVRRVAAKVLPTLRQADLMSVQGEELLILLPETDRLGAMLVQERIASLAEDAPALRLGTASFPEDDGDPGDLVASARSRATRDPFGSLPGLRRLDFWAAIERLSEGGVPASDTWHRGQLTQGLWGEALREALRELARASTARGFLVVCHGAEERDDGLWEHLPRHPLPGLVLHGVGGRDRQVRHPSVREVFLGADTRAARYQVALFLAGHAAYGMILDPQRVGAGFHCADEPLVRTLVAKFRDTYDLR